MYLHHPVRPLLANPNIAKLTRLGIVQLTFYDSDSLFNEPTPSLRNVSTNAHAFRTGIHHLLISESGRHRARHTGSQPYTATSSCCFNTHRWLSLCVISVSFLSVLPLFFGGRFWCSGIGFALLLFPLLSIRFIHHGRHILRWIWHSLRWMQNRLLLLIRKLIRLQRDRLRKSRPLTHWMRILRKRRPQHLRLRLLRSDL